VDNPIEPELIVFESKGTTVSALSFTDLNATEAVIHDVDDRHVKTALLSKNCKSAEYLINWTKQQKEERKKRNKIINDRAADMREKVNTIRCQRELVAQHNEKRIGQVAEILKCIEKRMEQKKQEQQLLFEVMEMLRDGLAFDQNLEMRLEAIESNVRSLKGFIANVDAKEES